MKESFYEDSLTNNKTDNVTTTTDHPTVTQDTNVEDTASVKIVDSTLEPVLDTTESEGPVWVANNVPDDRANAVRAPESLIPSIKEKKILTGDDDKDEGVIFTLRGTLKSSLAALEGMDDTVFDSPEQEAERAEWMKRIIKAQQEFSLSRDQLFEATIRPNSKWVNMLNFGTAESPAYKGIVSDRKGINPRDKNDKSALGLTKTLSVLGLGLPNYVPLYHTGIWVNLSTPTAAAFARLDELLTLEKQRHGALTRGEIFSNESIVLRKHVANFILDHVSWTNAPSSDKDYLKSIIKTMDLDVLMLGIMQNRYPEGYNFAQTCTANPNKCTHTVEGLIDLRELSWTDEVMLTDKQLKLMNNPRRVITEEQLKEYQDEFKIIAKSRIIIDSEQHALVSENDLDTVMNGIVINLDCPTLEKDEDYGVRWINELVRNAENVFREKHQENERRRRISEEVLMCYFKTYAAWIKSIEVYDGGQMIQEITDEDTLNLMFEHLSSDVKYVELFRKLKDEYITNNIVTIIGVLNYECPNCGEKHDTSKGKHHIILPIDVLYTFFTLVQSSVRRSFLKSSI